MESNKKPEEQDSNDTESLPQYDAALQLLFHEGQLYWQTFGAFLLAQTVFLAVLLQSLSAPPLFLFRPGAFFAAILGIVLCIPWLSSLLRSSGFHTLRIEQTKVAEPSKWKLLSIDGECFAEGEEVNIGGKPLRMHCLAQYLRTTASAKFLIALFAIGYLVIIIVSGPWVPTKALADQSGAVGTPAVMFPPNNSLLQPTEHSGSGKDWVDILSAMLTPIIAILGIYIAYQQSKTNKNRLKLELFEKRYEIFMSIKKFIANILSSGLVEQGAEIQFLRDIKSVVFLFDENIANLTMEVYKKANTLHALEKTEKSHFGEKLDNNLDKQNEIKEWFQQQLNGIDVVFKKFLKIEH